MTTRISDLLQPQLTSAKLTFRQVSRSPRILIVLSLGILCLWGCYYAGNFVFGKLNLGANPATHLLMKKAIGFVFSFFSYLLLFSTLLASLTHHYLAADLSLLISSPIPVMRIFYSRMISAWAQNSWMVFIFAWPMLASCGAQLDAPWTFYVVLTFCLLLLTVWCVAIASICALILARFFPARRLQEVLVIFVVITFVYLYYKFNAARPDRFFSEGGFEDLRDFLAGLGEIGDQSGLVGWSVQGIFATISPQTGLLGFWGTAPQESLALPLAQLTMLITGLIVSVGLLAHKLYVPGYWLCQEGIGRAGESTKRRSEPAYASQKLSALVRRDWQIFWRSPSQWTQLLLIGSLGIVYIYNLKYFHILHTTQFFSTATLYVTHVSLTGLVMITLAARFLYPSVSMEGKAIWVLRSAPLSARSLLASKVAWARFPLLGLSTALSLTGAWLTQLSGAWVILIVWSGWLLTWAILGLSIGLGARSPRFNLANPQMVTAGLGGITFMLNALLCVGIFTMLSFPSASALMLAEHVAGDQGAWGRGIISVYQQYGLWPFVMWLSVNLFAFAVYRGSLAWGARGLERVLLQEIQTEG